MWGNLISNLISGLINGLINVLWDNLINDLMKSDSAVCILLVKAGFNACKWFNKWFKR